MWRYLSTAFWLSIAIPSLGSVPINAIICFCFLLIGLLELIKFGHSGMWFLGAGLEGIYLYLLASNPAFQRWADAMSLEQQREDSTEKRQYLLQNLANSSRDRYLAIENKTQQILNYQQHNQLESYLIENNQKALKQLSWTYLRLLIMQQNIQRTKSNTQEVQVQRQIEILQKELTAPNLAEGLRKRKQETINALQQQQAVFAQHHTSLQEIHSDLLHIEAQIDLAVQNAMLANNQQNLISSEIDLATDLLKISDRLHKDLI